MNQRGNIALYVGLAIVGVVLILGAGVGIRYYNQKQEKPALENKQDQLTQQPKPEELKPVVEDEAKNWKTYRNDEFGFEFQYPKEWGEIILKDGNRATAPSFEGPGEATLKYGPPGIASFVSDKDITFSSSPLNGGFNILNIDPQNPYVIPFNINLLEDKTKLEQIPLGNQGTFLNSHGIKIIGYPDGFSSIDTSVTTFYKFYGDYLEIEGGLGYAPYYGTPEEIEFREYDCNNHEKYGKDPLPGECGIIRWVKDGKTSEKIRNAFNTFHQIVDSFKFISK